MTFVKILFILFHVIFICFCDEFSKSEVNDLISTLLKLKQVQRHPRSNETQVLWKGHTTKEPSSSTVYNYWLLPKVSLPHILPAKELAVKDNKQTYGSAVTEQSPVQSKLEKLREEIRYQSLVKKTNKEFLGFLDKLIEDKKLELKEEEKQIKDEYEELNRTREALIRAYGRNECGRLEELKKRVAEKEALYQQLLSLKRSRRLTRSAGYDTPWINVNLPNRYISRSLRLKKSEDDYEDIDYHMPMWATSTMSTKELFWKSLKKYLPFQRAGFADDGSLPLEIHYRVGKDVAHLTIKVPALELSATTTPFPVPFKHDINKSI